MGRETNDITAEITIKRTIDLKYQRSQIAKIKKATLLKCILVYHTF